MNKEQLLNALESEREKFLDLIEALSDEELQEPGIGGWSVKDILSHLSLWEAELIKLLWQLNHGQPPSSAHFQEASIDQVNEEWRKKTAGRALEQVLEDFHAVRTQTIRRVESLSDRDLTEPGRFPALQDRPLWDWIQDDSSGHEAEHAGQIQAWLESRKR